MQLALTYDASHAGADDWTEVLAWFRRAVDVIGHKEVAYRLDVQPSNLTDALNERERKDVKAKWIAVVLRLCSETMVREYLEVISKQHGFEEPKRKKTRTPEEELRDMREALARVAPGVLVLIDRDLGR